MELIWHKNSQQKEKQKLHQRLSALFDTLEENEDRIKHMEAQVHKLTAEVRDGKSE